MTSRHSTDRTQPVIHVHIDMARELLTITRDDEVQAIAAWPMDVIERASAVASVSFDFGGRHVVFKTRHGDRIVVELPNGDHLEPVGNRPVIYLDQNHSSAISKARYEPERLPEDERAAAEKLYVLARDQAVIVPLSAGHVAETCQWADRERRYHLAVTILELSRGWQMRDVLHLRRGELQRALALWRGLPPPLSPAPVTLEPGAVFGGRPTVVSPRSNSPLTYRLWQLRSTRCR
jgi:hypothetical protein